VIKNVAYCGAKLTGVNFAPSINFIRFCFDDPAHADAFAAQFGGERITLERITLMPR
jgi:hypothetical protein